MNQVNYGIAQGQLTLRNLRLKRGALDKFRLPVDVLEGYLGTFTLSLHWMNLGNRPVEILIEDVYLLVVPSSQNDIDPEEEEERLQAAKQERLRNAELLHVKSQTDAIPADKSSQSLWDSLTAKIVNNLQVTVKNIHVRYEDKMSVPGHLLSAGATLASFSVRSVDEKWEPAFIQSTAGAIHKLANLSSLAVYFDTDSQSMANLSLHEVREKLVSTISLNNVSPSHQFILSPVSGEGRVVLNHRMNNKTPHYDVRLLFDEIGLSLDEEQYHDALSLVDMYHVYLRQRQYRKYRPRDEEIAGNRGRAYLKFAIDAILNEVRERRWKWSWAYFSERRDDRNKYVELFKRRVMNTLREGEALLQTLERKLSYEDIRFYRSIARSQLRKDAAQRKKLEEERAQQQQQSRSWTSWLWGASSDDKPAEDPVFSGNMTEEQRRQLYEALDYDERSAIAEAFETPRDALLLHVAAELKKGLFALKTEPRRNAKDVISTIFDSFRADFVQRPDNFEMSLSLGGFSVYDGTTANTVHPQIVQVKNPDSKKVKPRGHGEPDDPFFFLKFENKPLDQRADTALTACMRHMEIIYHKGYIEAITKFLKPPKSQLESVEALLNVASQTFEGLRKETRAGLEQALQTHKTIDLHVDMNAPVIVIPENVTSTSGGHLVIDAGHISIESDLVDKNILREIQAKRSRQYNEDDRRRLESVMYDKVLLRLDAAQFIIGNDLQACRDALVSETVDSLHLLERTNIELDIQSSIIPNAVDLARFKVAGKLPSLHINVSDAKYKTLMRLIDVGIPNLDDGSQNTANHVDKGHLVLPLSAGLFRSEAEYNIEDSQSIEEDRRSVQGDFFKAGVETLRQRFLQFDFAVDELRATILKSYGDRHEKALGDLTLQRFRLACSFLELKIKVDIKLENMAMNVAHSPGEPLQLVSSDRAEGDGDEDLLSVSYTRIQETSPDFSVKYDGFEQSVDVCLSTFIFRAVPEPVISLYDFIMSTFVPQNNDLPAVQTSPEQSDQAVDRVTSGAIRVTVNLDSIRIMLIDDASSLATLSLSTAYIFVSMESGMMVVTGRLGSLALSDDRAVDVCQLGFKQILSIEDKNFAEFRYRTCNSTEADLAGVNSSIHLTTGSLRVHFVEQPLRDIYLFAVKLAKLKVLYDAARDAAVQKASEIERIQFEVSVKSPIIVFPCDSARAPDVLIMRLGEITARNSYEGYSNKVTASLRGIQLVSEFQYDGKPSRLKIVDDIDILADALQVTGVDHSRDTVSPDIQVAIEVSDVKLHLTQDQYRILVELSRSIPRVFASDTVAHMDSTMSPSSNQVDESSHNESKRLGGVDLEPEVRITTTAEGARPWTIIDLVASVNVIKLHLYDTGASTEATLRNHGIVRLALNDTTLRCKSISDGALEAQLVLKSFTMNDTRIGPSKFREIIPAADHDRNQFMTLYTSSGTSSLMIVTVDSPHIIFAIEPLIALISFFTSAPPATVDDGDAADGKSRPSAPQSDLAVRLELHDVSISVLEEDSNVHSQAIKLYIDQILLCQQFTTVLTISKLGMSLIQMGAESDAVRFLDDVDLTLSLENRSSIQEQLLNIEISTNPIIFRVSYRDILLITAIATKASQLYGKSQENQLGGSDRSSENRSMVMQFDTSRSRLGRAVGEARVMMSKQQMKAVIDGFRLILIGDMHEQPMVDLSLTPFVVNLKDWSSELNAATVVSTHINFWNLTNSHWEPLIDPWKFTLSLVKEHLSDGFKVSLTARDRLDLNISTALVELALASMKMLGNEGEGVLQRARGSYAPYRIRNRTGFPLFVWPDEGAGVSLTEASAVKVSHNQSVDWRFDDWRTMREHVPVSEQHNIGVQIAGKPWDAVRGIPVDREGEFTFSLRPRGEKFIDRLLCAITVENNVKIVTLRSTYLVVNQTFYPLELMLVDNSGRPVYSVEKILPGQDYALPIEAVTRNRVRLQPDQGFGYKWCSSLRFDDLVLKRSLTIQCPHSDPGEAPFRFQAWAQTDPCDLTMRKSPKITLKLRAPIELENLLPYNVQYRIFDKHANTNWRSYLRKGGIMPIHSVELGHLVLLSVEVQDTIFSPSEFAIINVDTQLEFDVESRLTVRDQNNRELHLKLNYVRYPESGGAFRVQVYTPYLIVNKTGMLFGVKAVRSNRAASPIEVAGDSRPEILKTSTPLLLSHPYESGHAFVFQVEDSILSNVIGLEAPAADTRLVVPSSKQKNEEYHIGLSWTEGLGKYKLTKVITLAPRFLLKNNLSEPLQVREYQGVPRGRAVVNPGERFPLQVMRAGQEQLLTVTRPGLNARWSAPISLEDIGIVHLRLPVDENQIENVMADIKLNGSIIFVTFSKSDGWPFEVENQSDETVVICQWDASRSGSNSTPVKSTYPRYKVAPHSRVPYAWDQPAAKEKRLLLTIYDTRRIIDIMEIGVLVPFKFRDRHRSRAVSLDVRAEGQKQVLRITPYVAERSVFKPKHTKSESLSRSDSLASTEAFEAVAEDLTSIITVTVDLSGIGISLMNRKVVEVVYISLDSLQLEYNESPISQAVTVSCGSLRIDNQLHEAVYPVILQPTPITKEARGLAGAPPTIQASFVWLKDQEHGVLFVKYCSVLLQALTLQADEDVLFAIYDLVHVKGISWEAESEDILIRYPDEIPEPQSTAAGRAVYFEVLELQPIQLTLSFTRTERISSEEKLSIRNPLAVVINALTMTLGNVDNARLELNALVIQDVRLTPPELQSRIAYHYRQDVLRQLYRILGSANFIGNPVGLFTNVSSGVADIFYAPYHGVVMHGNKELGIGIAKGAASFVKKTVFGLSDSVTKFTSSVGKGLSAATFDSEYQAQRRVSQRRNRPRHVIYGVTAGGEAFANSVFSAVEGIVTKPIQGAETEGAVGFFKGIGKGLVGAVTKPAVGVFDLAANLSEGIRNTTTVFDRPQLDRVRLPRHIPPDGVLVPYSHREALGQYWMRDLENGAYRGESYVAHIDLPGGDVVVLLTTSRVLSFTSRRLRLDWDLPFSDIQGVTTEDNGIRFSHKSGRDYDRFVLIPDKNTLAWFFGQIASVVKSFNARRRMDS
ncbi:vacuolar protein sorting-associated protein 13 [Pisolithus croceorrhizus]|nr:vacuolar protein sorting-associated protein 13 [Pisolithus croceorrhizus]